MSKQIDQRIVEMQFNNKQFEANAKQSLSTLDKLKQKLNLTGASKGLENLNTAANKVNMSGLSGALDTVSSRFSAMEVIGVTALANITNSAVNAGKRMVHALTVAPVSDGFHEYEMTLNAIQTTMAGTGKTAKEVEKELKKLDAYADKTVYSTADMLNNLPKFTNAGVELEKATQAMIGIANATAHAGGDASKASIAFYNLGQAIGTGYLTRMDYNSINNAGIATMQWKEQMVEAALAAGTLKKAQNGLYKAGKKTFTIQQLFIDGLQEQWATTDVMMKVFGDYGDETTEIGKKAYESAQKIKTFSMMMDSLKATAGTGWKDTWQIIFGDLDQAAKFWTGLNNFISGIITKIADVRNYILNKVLNTKFNPFGDLLDKLENSGVGKIVKKVGTISRSLEEYQKIVNKVWRGDYNNRGDNPDRYDLLSKEGWNPRVVQNLVNYGYKHKITIDEIAKAEKKYGVTAEETTKSIENLTDAQLKQAGLSKSEIEMYRYLEKEAKRTGKSIEEVAKSMEQMDGRTLLIDSFKNAGKGLVSVFKAIGEAWTDAFPVDETAFGLYKLINGIHEFSKNLVMSKDTAKDLTRTLKGVFAILDLISMVVGGAFKIAFTILKTVLGMFNIDILEFTAIIGDAIVAFRDWVEQFNPIVILTKKLTPLIIKMGKAVGKFAKELWNLPAVQKVVTKIADAFGKLDDISLNDVINMFKKLGKAIKNLFSNINKHFDGAPGHILTGLANGLKNGISTVITAISNLASSIVKKFCEILGIHSPSTVFFAIGGFIIAGLIGGLLAGVPGIGDATGNITDKIVEFFTNTNWGEIFSKLFAGGMSIGLLMIAKNLSTTLSNFSQLAGGLGSMFDGVGDVARNFADNMKRISKAVSYTIKSFGKVMRGIAFKKYAEGIKELALSLLIIAGAVYLLAQLDYGKLWSAVGAILVLAGILAGLTIALGLLNAESVKITKKGKDFSANFNSTKVSIFAIGAALLMMAGVMKILGSMSVTEYIQGIWGLLTVVSMLALFMVAYGGLVKGKAAQNMDKAGKMLKKLGTTLLLLVIVMKLAGTLDQTEMINGVGVMGALILLVAGMTILTQGASKHIDKIGSTVLKISLALLLIIAVMKLAGSLSQDQMIKGIGIMGAFVIFVWSLVAVGQIGKDQQIAKIGGTILAISVAMLLMVGVMKIIGTMDLGAFAKGIGAIFVLGAIIAGLLYMVKKIGPEAPKLAATILAMGIAIGILAAVSVVMSLISLPGLAKGVAAVGAFGLILGLLIKVTKGAHDVKGTVMAMATAIGIMAASVAILSFIKPEKLLTAVFAMTILMAMFALIENQSKYAFGSLGTLITITVAIGIMAAALAVLANMPIEGLLPAAGALSLLMLTMAGVLAIISKFPPVSGLQNAAIGLGIIGVALLALVGVLALMSNVKNAMTNAVALSTLLLTMTAVFAVLTLIGAAAPAALAGMGLFALFIAGLTAIIAGLGGLTKIDGFNDLINNGINLLIQLATGLGEMVGAFVKGAITQISASLPIIGTNLSLFMTNLSPFITGAKTIDEKVLAGIGILSAAIIALSVAELIEGVASFLTFGSSFADLGTQLSQFMINALPFLATAILIDPKIMNGVKALAETILILTSANLIEGLTSWLTGGVSFEEFGTQLVGLAKGLKMFLAELGVFTPDQVTTVDCACKAIKTLATVAKDIPNTGGLLGQLVGENDLSFFASQLPIVGFAVAEFVKTLTDANITSESVDIANKAADIIKVLANVAKEIPNTGGLLGQLVGENDLSTFAKGLPTVGKGIVDFINTLTTAKISEESLNLAKTAADVIKVLAKVAQDIPNTGGLLAALIGDNDLKKFAEKLPDVGKGIKNFVKELGTFGDDKVATVNAAVNAIKALTALAKIDLKTAKDQLNAFGGAMVGFGGKIASFVTNLTTVSAEDVTSAVTKVNQLVDMLKNIVTTKSQPIVDFSNALNNLGSEGITKFIEGFAGESPKEKAEKAGKEILQSVIKGIGNKIKALELKATAGDLSKDAVKAMKSKTIKDDAKSAGKDLVQGLINGLKDKDKRTAVYNAAYSLGELAVKGEKDGQKSNSPSKATEQAGKWLGEGLVIGIQNMGSKVYNAGRSMGEEATSSISNALNTAMNLLNSDMDTQPTIRPVLDLSEVQSGAGLINGMFGNVGVGANLNAISTSMNNRNQNGVNSDVVNAINKLRKDISNVGGTTNNYNVNGVTYDDGSNISTAVNDLVRAARIERRI